MNAQQHDTHEYLTVHELADLLRIKERKVYDLAASGALPCSRATGKLLFPASEIRDWIEGAKSGGATHKAPRTDIVLGSHDPLLDWAIRESRCGLATYFDGSHDGLGRFCNGEGIATGLHIYDAADQSWNAPEVQRAAVDQNAVLIRFATRRRGIVLRPDAPTLRGVGDLKGMSIVPRQAESGTAGLFRDMMKAAGLDPSDVVFTDVARTEDEAVQAVSRGEADATFGLESVAQVFGLSFVPVIKEHFDLLVDRKAYFDPAFQSLAAFFTSEKFLRRATGQTGYDASEAGKIIWNA